MFQLRYLQTLNSISAENNSTIVFPVPIDVISGMMNQGGGGFACSPQFMVCIISCRYSTTHEMMYTVHRCSSLLQVKMWM